MPEADGKFLVTVETTDPWDEPIRKVYSDCGYDAEAKRFYFYETVSEPHHLGSGDSFRIYIDPKSRIVTTGTALAWMPMVEIEPYDL